MNLHAEFYGNPLVTVYIPTCNRPGLLKRAVESVLTQSYRNIELIVVVDGPDIDSIKYLKAKSTIDNRLKFFVNSTRSGACVCRNKAIHNASGEFITGLDDDDYFKKDRIKVFLKAWQNKRANIIAISASSQILLPEGKTKKPVIRPKFIRRKDLIQANFIGNQVFSRLSTFREVGGFDPNFPAWQDYELWFRILSNEETRVWCIKDITYVHDTSHLHERITDGKKGAIKKAFDLFVEKHRLNRLETRFLYSTYLSYGNNKPYFVTELIKLYYFHNWPAVRSFMKSVFAFFGYSRK